VLGRHSRDSNRIQMNRCSWGDFTIFCLRLDRAKGREYDGMVDGEVPSLRDLIESDLRLTDPAGEFGAERRRVPSLIVNGVLWILGRNDCIVVPEGPAGSAMMEEAREQIEMRLMVGAVMGA